MISRRHFFQTAGLTVAGSALPGIAAEPRPALPRSPVLSQALLDNVTRTLGGTSALLHQRHAGRGEISHAADSVAMLREHFLELNLDAQIKAAAHKTDTSAWSRVDALEAAFLALKGSDPTLNREEFSRVDVNIDAGLQELRNRGIVTSLVGIEVELRHARVVASTYVRHWEYPKVAVRRAFQGGFCPTWSFYVDSFSAAFFILTLFGCGPEPLFPLLCPALLTFATMLGFASVLSWVVC